MKASTLSPAVREKMRTLSWNNFSSKDVFTSKKFVSMLQMWLDTLANTLLAKSIGQNACQYKHFSVSVHKKTPLEFLSGQDCPALLSHNTIHIFLDSSYFKDLKLKSNEDWYVVICGLFAHELAHVLYSSFRTLHCACDGLRKSKWFPRAPKVKGVDGKTIRLRFAELTEPAFKLRIFTDMFATINNIFEDAYIENRFKQDLPGELSYFLQVDREFDKAANVMSVEQYIEAAHNSPFCFVPNILLCYAIHGKFIVEDKKTLEIPEIKALTHVLPLVNNFMVEDDPDERAYISLCAVVFLWHEIFSTATETELMTLLSMLKALMSSSEAQGSTSVQDSSSGALPGRGSEKPSAADKNRDITVKLLEQLLGQKLSNDSGSASRGSESSANHPAGSGKGNPSAEKETASQGPTSASKGCGGEDGDMDGSDAKNASQGSTESTAGRDDVSDEEEGACDDSSSQNTAGGADVDPEDGEATDGKVDDKSPDANAENSASNVGSSSDDASSNAESCGDQTSNDLSSAVPEAILDSVYEKESDYEYNADESVAAKIAEIENAMRIEKAETACEKELEARLNSEVNDFRTSLSGAAAMHKGVMYKIRRGPYVKNDELEIAYKQFIASFGPLSRRMQRQVEQKLKDHRQGGKITGLYSGKAIYTPALVQRENNDRLFYKNKLPSEMPEVSVAVLVDMSGSMSGKRITAAKMAASLLYDFCTALHLPVAVYGHRTISHPSGYTDGVELVSFADFNAADKNDKYRIMSIYSGGANRDGAAIAYMLNMLRKRSDDYKLFFIISDGRPAATAYGGQEAYDEMRAQVRAAKKKGITTIAAAIGDDLPALQSIYDTCLDMRKLDDLPQKLTSILVNAIKRNY